MAITDMGIAQIREGLASKQFSAHEVAQASLDHIAKADAQVHAFLELTADAAMQAAQRVDNAIAAGTFDQLGPLAGVPVAFKDNMNLAGTHTTCSSHMLENYVSPYTATCVQRIIDAGGLPLGKLNMDEFAFGSTTESSAFGPTHNPLTTSATSCFSATAESDATAKSGVPMKTTRMRLSPPRAWPGWSSEVGKGAVPLSTG